MKRKIRIFLGSAIAVMILAWLTGDWVVFAAEKPVEQQGLVDKARITFESFMADENMEWFKEHVNEAEGFLIVPDLLKGGFFLGGSGGSGVLVVKDEKTGDWSQPAFYTLGSVTFGLQIGGEKSEVIMMIRKRNTLESFYSSSFKLGGDTSAAVGPVGVGAKATVTASIISFARSKGAFIGLSLEGAVIKTSDSSNKAYYGKEVRPVDILVKKDVSNPGSAALRQALKKAIK
jgi:lipid-binding SYLF domain-containing protein